MKTKKRIKERIEELKNNKFYRTGKSYSRIGTPLWREIHAAIKELEWVLGE